MRRISLPILFLVLTLWLYGTQRNIRADYKDTTTYDTVTGKPAEFAAGVDGRGRQIQAGIVTSSTATVITSSTSIALTGSTTQIRIVPATTGTTYYMVGTGTAGATNSIPLTVGQITFDDTVRAGATVSLTGSGAVLIQQLH
jgi:hypothetical protein